MIGVKFPPIRPRFSKMFLDLAPIIFTQKSSQNRIVLLKGDLFQKNAVLFFGAHGMRSVNLAFVLLVRARKNKKI